MSVSFLLFLCCAELAGATRRANQLPGYNVIVGRGLFVELEGMDERVLYDYDEIIRCQNAVETALPVEALKLLPHYDAIRPASSLSSEDLLARELLGPRAPSLAIPAKGNRWPSTASWSSTMPSWTR